MIPQPVMGSYQSASQHAFLVTLKVPLATTALSAITIIRINSRAEGVDCQQHGLQIASTAPAKKKVCQTDVDTPYRRALKRAT